MRQMRANRKNDESSQVEDALKILDTIDSDED
jgi:hypothetical protein